MCVYVGPLSHPPLMNAATENERSQETMAVAHFCLDFTFHISLYSGPLARIGVYLLFFFFLIH